MSESKSEFAILREKAGIQIEELAALCGKSKRTIYRWENGVSQPEKLAVEKLEQMIKDPELGYEVNAPKFTFIDLFAGIGGLRRGFEPLGGKCVFTSEWNVYSQQTYRANYGFSEHIAGDITKIVAEDIPQHDLLLAGFPCQPFSIAGVSKKNALHQPHGFHCETQGTLFFDVARIIEHHRPKAFLLENVKNLVNHDKGKTFATIRNVLENELGYQMHYKLIDAKSWVPQHRERIIMVGFREPNAFNIDDMGIPDPLAGPRLCTILHPENGTEPFEENSKYIDTPQGSVKEKYTLSTHLWDYLKQYSEKHKAKGNGFGFGLVGPNNIARTLSARYYKDGSEILIMRENGNPRRLTPRECSRLMGFDKPDGSDFVIPVSDTQAYRQFGNAVVVPMVETVARHMLPWLVPTQLGFAGILGEEALQPVG